MSRNPLSDTDSDSEDDPDYLPSVGIQNEESISETSGLILNGTELEDNIDGSSNDDSETDNERNNESDSDEIYMDDLSGRAFLYESSLPPTLISNVMAGPSGSNSDLGRGHRRRGFTRRALFNIYGDGSRGGRGRKRIVPRRRHTDSESSSDDVSIPPHLTAITEQSATEGIMAVQTDSSVVAGPSVSCNGRNKGRKRNRKAKPTKFIRTRPIRKAVRRKVIRRRVDPDNAADFQTAILDDCKLKCFLHFENDGSPASKQAAYKVGEINLNILGTDPIENFPEEPILSQVNLLKAFTGQGETLTNVILHVSDIPTRSVIAINREKKIINENPVNSKEPIIIEEMTFYYFIDLNGFDHDLFKGFTIWSRCPLRLDIVEFHKHTRTLNLNALIFRHGIYKLHGKVVPSKLEYLAPAAKILRHFYGVVDNTLRWKAEANRKEDLAWFFGLLKKYHEQESLPLVSLQVLNEYLVPKLRDYQKKAIAWMLTRESFHADNYKSDKLDLRKWIFDSLFTPIQLGELISRESDHEDLQNGNAYLNKSGGYVTWQKPEIPEIPSGGILADEMGLGKTVEVLALILLNPRPSLVLENKNDKIYCSSSSLSDSLVELIERTDSDDEDYCVTNKRNLKKKIYKRSNKRKNYNMKAKPKLKGRRKIKFPVFGLTKSKNKRANDDGLEHPKFKRKRSISPCEFEAKKLSGSSDQSKTASNCKGGNSNFDDDLVMNGNDSDEVGTTSSWVGRKRRILQVDESNSDENDEEQLKKLPCVPGEFKNIIESRNKKKVESSSESETYMPPRKSRTKKVVQVPESTYARVKVMYDAALQEFSTSKFVRMPGKFHGEFFNPFVGPKSYFECVCGEDESDLHNQNVVTCVKCSSSQHSTCIRYNKKRNGGIDRKSYLCPQCIATEEPIQSKTTLIITPTTISHQWISEIKRHVTGKHLKILLYEGVKKHGYIPSYLLATYDIIISTYTVLSAELSHLDLPHTNSYEGRRFRNAKRFLPIPSPLTSVLWWRVCLDEAQMVESGTTRVANMARRLTATHRWCITGTPINKGLEDLYGLIAFLGVHPLDDETWWNFLVTEPFYNRDYQFLYELFGQLIWRTGKQDVLEQLGVPPQVEIVHTLKFSALEKLFYKRQFEDCGKTILTKIARNGMENLNLKLSSLNRQILDSLLDPLLKLRQACVHPQMVRGETLNFGKNVGNMTMEELLNQLIKKTVVQCADDHRRIVSALNGIASIHFIMENFVESAKKYREVLQLSAKHEKTFSTDTLQMLHAQTNMADILDMNVSGVGFTLRDDNLREKADELRKAYLEKYATGVKKAREAGSALTRGVEDLVNKTGSDTKLSWFAQVLNHAHKMNKHINLVSTIKDDLKLYASKRKNTGSMGNLFQNASGLEHVLIGKIIEIDSMRNSVLLSLEDLESRDPSSFVNAAVSCHLREKTSVGGRTNRCNLCTYHDQFLSYEFMLFAEEKSDKVIRTGRNRQKLLPGILTKEELDLNLKREEEELLQTTEHVNLLTNQHRGTWADSDTEKVLKHILSFGKINHVPNETLEDGKTHLKILDAMKKEFKVLRVLWSQIYDQVSAFDELDQATTRLRLRSELEGNEPGPSSAISKQAKKELKSGVNDKLEKIQNIHVLERHQLEYKMQEMTDELEMSNQKLIVHLGQFMYLETLKKNGYGKNGTINSEDCPICACQLGHEWSVLICGHSFCSECVKKMCSANKQSFLCPLCRISTNMKHVSFVDTRGTHVDDNEEPTTSSTTQSVKVVKGSHSTKVEAIIETLLKLQDSHPGEKVLIFSTWSDMLTIIGRAMEENDIRHNMLTSSGGKPFEKILDRFKTREDVQALLMQLSSGSKGLNIVEATHVFLVEPILNLASELQAIGRVHRIGQMKKTFVHRFYVKDTIEEQLFKILRNHDISDDDLSLTVAELRDLVTS